MMAIINEFIDALAIEIDALKKEKGGSIVTVYNGELFRQTLELYIYQFRLENFLVAIDDTPASLEVNGKEYECNIISIVGQQVQISVEQKLAERIPMAKIKTNTWYLLERLKKKYEDNISSQSRFENSNKLFEDQNSNIDGSHFETSYSINGKPPNKSQHNAIESSINDFISIIWGPPGTGKTATVARAIESHLNLGRKVLLLAHSNNAVDQALIKVAAQMKNTYFPEGQIVRLGTPKPEMLSTIEAEFPLVLIEKIAEFKSQELKREKEVLTLQIIKIEEFKKSFGTIVTLNDEIENLAKQLNGLFSEKSTHEEKIKSTKAEIQTLNDEIKELKYKLIKAKNAGFLKRTFLGLDPEKIETKLKSVTSATSIKTNQLNNLEEQLTQLNQSIEPLQLESTIKEQELLKQLTNIDKTLSEVQSELNAFDSAMAGIQLRLDEINKAIEEIKVKILSDSKLVATTLTKSYIAKEIETIDFDILIVDEVSMAPMPMLYWAASKAKKGITIVGDFKQLPPICISDDDAAKKWLGRSIFDQLGISEISKATKRVKLLDIQYRMNPAISEIPRTHIYENLLKDGETANEKWKDDGFIGKTPICLIDTSPNNPWCSQLEAGGRFNLISALVCVNLAERIAESFTNKESIGIITPYRNQARLILKILEERGISNSNVRVNTVHSFQGGEETAIIFDSVEGEGAKKWSMINEFNNVESAKLLLNVAMTRAESKLYVVANYNFISANFDCNSLFMDVLRHFISKGTVIKSTELISNTRDENFDYWIEKLNSLENRPENFGISYTDEEFWPAFHNDLAHTQNELIIFSPFLTPDRLGKLYLIFTQLLNKGIDIYLITLSPKQQPIAMKGSKEVIIKLKEMGVTIKFRQSMHEKIAIIDREIKWIGSLNILSHNSNKEYMERVKGESSAKEIFDKFDLEELLINQNINGEYCPTCQAKGESNFIVHKYSRQNRQFFYGCESYPECDFTANIKINTLEDVKQRSTGTRKKRPSPNKQKTQRQLTSTNNEAKKDLFGIETAGRQWESKLLYWSSVELPGYTYSNKKNAWWKSK